MQQQKGIYLTEDGIMDAGPFFFHLSKVNDILKQQVSNDSCDIYKTYDDKRYKVSTSQI